MIGAVIDCGGSHIESGDAYGTKWGHFQTQGARSRFETLGVERLFLFGSTARSETRKDSDVDLFQLMNVKDLARRILDRSTDIMTRASLHPVLRKRIEATAFRVF